MNIFVPQSLATMIELKEIADVKRNIITPRLSVPIIGIVQDGLLGSYNLTQPNMRIDWKSAMNIMSYTTIDNLETMKKKDITGQELFSMIIPSKITTKNKGLHVKKGVIEKGQVTKAHIGSEKENSLIHLIWDAYGKEETQQFIDNVQRLVNNFNLWNGFTVGIGDIEVPENVVDEMNTMFETEKLKVTHMLTEMENNPNILDPTIFEATVFNKLSSILDRVSKLVLDNLRKDNNFNIMISSGSKGKPFNMGQMGGCVGQTGVEGQRIKKKVNGRTLPYFYKDDDTALARGFCQSSFLEGLNATEFMFHNMGSREGLIDTAIKSVTGDTPIVVMENGNTKRVLIGEWIDKKLDKKKDDVEHYEERDMELLKTEFESMYIPTADEKGVTSWGKITAITRHDPGKELYEIKTLGGRNVIVTESKSLLIWNEKTREFEQMSTPDVKIGNFVPTTMSLPEPPVKTRYIDMTKYFSKTKYIYGTDFVRASTMMEKLLVEKSKVPDGWWDSNNGKTFSLPYNHAHKLRRVLRRSDVKNIHEGYIYPFSTLRKFTIPDKFELNRENGMFFGLYIAEGNSDGNYIQITNNDSKIRKFVSSWFEKHGINTVEATKINHIGGTSLCIRGGSSILSKFLKQSMGHGARNKRMPDEAFNAPLDFVKGLLDGYFSGDGTITKNSIQTGSASRELIEGISMLCNRLGIFGKIPIARMKSNNLETKNIADINVFSIRGQWAKKFADEIDLMDDKKNKKLKKEMKPSNVHRNYDVSNDVVLDKIVEINKIDVKKYPKVYDLTIPSTLNFGLANGLQVVDTASSGYVQRKFIKALEDISVKYDCTIRSASNTILQYIYGDSGADTIRQSRMNSELAEMTNKQVADKYMFKDTELKQVKLSKEENKKQYELMINLRNEFRFYMLRAQRNYANLTTTYMCPVNFYRIIPSAQGEDYPKKTALTADHVIKSIEDMLLYENTKLTCMNKKEADDKSSIKHIDEQVAKTLFRYALYEFLGPKMAIVEHGLTKEQFDSIMAQVKRNYNKSIVEPGEMTGILAAQSLGEPVTQNTLNSVDYNCEVLIKQGNTMKIIKTGELIDKLLFKNIDRIERPESSDKEKGDLYYLNTKNQNIYIQSVDEDGKVSWNKIDAITKHLPINKDGTNTLLKVTTRLGKEVIATKAKSFLTMKNEKLVFTRGDEIKEGDLLPVTKKLEIKEKINEFDISKYFSKTEYIYGTDLRIAKQHRIKTYECGSRNWYTGFNGKKFTLPYNRADSIVGVINNNLLMEKYKEGCIYSKNTRFVSNIPEKIILDKVSGFFFGSYLAEGLSTKNFISISNNDDVFINRIVEFSKRYNIGYHITKQVNKNKHGWTSQDIRLHSTILAKIMINECDTGSENKFIPDFAYNANDDFIKGLIDGYFSGDGNISSKQFISATSISKKLLDGISILLMRFGIRSKISVPTIIKTNNRGSNNIKQHYILAIRNDGVKIFKDLFKLTSIKKQEKLEAIATHNFRHNNGRYEKIPVNIDGSDSIMTMTEALKIRNKSIKKIINSDVFFDEIVSIEEVEPSHKYVYDFTVEPDKTFALASGLLLADTFHSAGIAAMGTANLGVGRTVELLSLSKNPKEPIMKIYLIDEHKGNKLIANKIASHIKYTTIGDLTKNINIYFDPEPFAKDGFMEADDVHNIFHSHNATKNSCQSDINNLPWLIRIELDREKLLNKEITLIDIKSKFCNNWERRYIDLRGVKKDEKQLLEKISQCAVLSNTDNHKQPILHIRVDMNEFDYSTVINFQDIIINNFKLKGFEDIDDVMGVNSEWYIRENKETGEFEKKQQFVVYTKGINLIDIRNLHNIDLSMTMCNDVVKTYETFGIEAARATLLRELKTNIKEDTCNYQHFSVLVDLMCYTGGLVSIDRHGMNKLDTDPLAKASFEKTVDMLLTAAVFGEKDKMKSVSSRIMAGMTIKGGTGMCDLLVDHDMISHSEYLEEAEIAKSDFKEIQGEGIIDEVESDLESDLEDDMYIP